METTTQTSKMVDTLCPHGWAQDVACDECGRSGFRWVGVNEPTPVSLTAMTCDTCGRKFNYCFYINDEFWMKAVGKAEGHHCAHCVLEMLGGLEWWIVWNEQTERIMHNSTGSERGKPLMRQIKFRAWDTTEKCWDTPSKVHGMDGYFSSCGGSFIRFNRADVVLMQFTGLLDKNGKEIYEGDIVNTLIVDRVEYSDNVPEDCWGRERGRDERSNVVIQFEEFGWWVGEDQHLSQFSYEDEDQWIEVVGNVYENPELIGEANEVQMQQS